jgi:hypothetical protein
MRTRSQALWYLGALSSALVLGCSSSSANGIDRSGMDAGDAGGSPGSDSGADAGPPEADTGPPDAGGAAELCTQTGGTVVQTYCSASQPFAAYTCATGENGAICDPGPGETNPTIPECVCGWPGGTSQCFDPVKGCVASPTCGLHAPTNPCGSCLMTDCCSQLLACSADMGCAGAIQCLKLSCDYDRGCASMCNTGREFDAGDDYLACMASHCAEACP